MKPYYVTKPDHNHESADVLTIGCPACILKVRSEQELGVIVYVMLALEDP